MSRCRISSSLATVVLAVLIPVADAAAPLVGSGYTGKGKRWTLNVGVSANARRAHVNVGVPMRCVSHGGIRQRFTMSFEFDAPISPAGGLNYTYRYFKRTRTGVYKGQTTRKTVRLRGAFDGDKLSLRVSASHRQEIDQMFQRCATAGGTIRMHASRTHPPYRFGTYTGTTSNDTPVGPVHVTYPGTIRRGEVFGIADRFVFVARLTCYGGDSDASPYEDRAFDVPTADLPLTLRQGSWGFNFAGPVGDTMLTVWARFFGKDLRGGYTAEPLPGAPGKRCRGEGNISGTWQPG